MECLNVQRASEFVAFALENDLQIAINRRTALNRIRSALATEGDPPTTCFEWPAESYEKMETFLSQNDAQVHYSGTNTVAVYSMVRLLGSLRRALRDMRTVAGAHFQGSLLASPTREGTRSVALHSPVRQLTYGTGGVEGTPLGSPRAETSGAHTGAGPLGKGIDEARKQAERL